MGKPVFATANSLFAPSSEGIHQLLEEKKVSLVYDFAKFLDRFFSSSKVIPNSIRNLISRPNFSETELKILDTITQKSEC